MGLRRRASRGAAAGFREGEARLDGEPARISARGFARQVLEIARGLHQVDGCPPFQISKKGGADAGLLHRGQGARLLPSKPVPARIQ